MSNQKLWVQIPLLPCFFFLMLIFLEYKFLIISLILFFIVSLVFILLSYFIILRKPTIEKNSAYECGFQPFADARIPFDIHFYLVGLLFLIFDLEFLFIIPYVLCITFLSLFSYFIFLFFIFVLIIGFIFE